MKKSKAISPKGWQLWPLKNPAHDLSSVLKKYCIHLCIVCSCFHYNSREKLQLYIITRPQNLKHLLSSLQEKKIVSLCPDKQSKNEVKDLSPDSPEVSSLYWSPPSITSLMIFPWQKSYSPNSGEQTLYSFSTAQTLTTVNYN